MTLPANAFGRSAAVEEREVMLADGSKHRLHFRPPPRMVWYHLTVADSVKEPEKFEAAGNELIAAMLVEPGDDGKGWRPALTAEQASQLEEETWLRMLSACMKWRTEKAEDAGKA